MFIKGGIFYMDLTTCKLYRVQRKRDLSNILKINCKEINKIVNSYKPYIANKSKKKTNWTS